jgi:hypothetical protein
MSNPDHNRRDAQLPYGRAARDKVILQRRLATEKAGRAASDKEARDSNSRNADLEERVEAAETHARTAEATAKSRGHILIVVIILTTIIVGFLLLTH